MTSDTEDPPELSGIRETLAPCAHVSPDEHARGLRCMECVLAHESRAVCDVFPWGSSDVFPWGHL